MQGDDDNRPAESSDTTGRDRAGTQAEPNRAGGQAESRRVVSDDSAAHDRHDEGAPAARRQELDRQQPLDASGNLAERVRATTFTADAKGAAAVDADAKGAADADAEAPGRGARAGVDGEKATPILAALAQLRNKQSERARRGSAPPRLRPVPSVGKPPPGRGLVGGGRVKERPKPAAPPLRSTRLTVYMTEAEADELDKAAQTRGTPLSAFLRYLIERGITTLAEKQQQP